MNHLGESSAAVLVVDDEALLRMLASDVLEEAGFEVVEAASADAALVALQSHPEIRVVFTDVDMPGSLDGLGLARVVQERWPGIGVLVVSGIGPEWHSGGVDRLGLLFAVLNAAFFA